MLIYLHHPWRRVCPSYRQTKQCEVLHRPGFESKLASQWGVTLTKNLSFLISTMRGWHVLQRVWKEKADKMMINISLIGVHNVSPSLSFPVALCLKKLAASEQL